MLRSCAYFILKVSLVLSTALPVGFPTLALAQGLPDAELEASQAMNGPRKQLATIIMSGLAGAVLGLSTLSFYGRPQEHLNNIAIGFAVGVIGGTIYTTYQAATAPTQFMNGMNNPHKVPPPQAPMVSMRFEFD